MKVKVLNNNCIPEREHDWDAGLDMKAAETVTIKPGENRQIGLGVCVQIPQGYVGLMCPRSSIGVKTMLRPSISVGVIDAGYTGEVHQPYTNTGDEPITLQEGERIGQLVVVPLLDFDLEFVDELEPTERGDGAFGSTGK